MKKFLEEYGFAILAAIVVILLIVMSSPVGTTIKTQIMGLINNFGITSKHKIDSINREVSVVLTQTPDLIITSPSTTDKFDYIIHYVENGEDKTSLPRPYEDGFTLTEKCDSNSNIFVEVVNKGTGEKYISNTIKVPEEGLPEPEYIKTFILADGLTINQKLKEINSVKPIKTIEFVDTKMPTSGITEITGLDADGDGGVVGWYIIDGYMTKIYISSQKSGQKVIANSNCQRLFHELKKVNYVDASLLDTSNVTNMTWMFSKIGGNAEVLDLDLSDWNVSNVTDMSGTFNGTGWASKTLKLNLSNWNTSNVTDMSSMFQFAGQESKSFEIKGLESWDTSSVTDMKYMFDNTGSKANYKLDLSNWNVDKVEEHNGFTFGISNGDKITHPIWKN